MKKISSISQSVYDEIENDNLFRVSLEEENVQTYVQQVLAEVKQNKPEVSSEQDNGDSDSSKGDKNNNGY